MGRAEEVRGLISLANVIRLLVAFIMTDKKSVGFRYIFTLSKQYLIPVHIRAVLNVSKNRSTQPTKTCQGGGCMDTTLHCFCPRCQGFIGR